MPKGRSRSRRALPPGGQSEPAAGNGILSRRFFLEGALVGGAASAGASGALAEPLAVESWMQEPGAGFAPYGQPSRFEGKVVRAILSPPNPLPVSARRVRRCTCSRGPSRPAACTSSAAIPGFPTSIPTGTGSSSTDWWRPLVFTLEALHRYPMQSRVAFIECAGNSGALNAPQPQPHGIAAIHGLLGCSEWTGVQTRDAARRGRRG